jgi:hypothetical protein
MKPYTRGGLRCAAYPGTTGAASAFRTKDSIGRTPMFIACCDGHLDVTERPFEVGAAVKIRTKTKMAGPRCELLAPKFTSA